MSSLSTVILIVVIISSLQFDVILSDTPQCPGQNEEYTTCTSRCPVTCANRNNPPICILVCGPGGCRCKNGYLKNKDNKCVLERDCS